MSNLVLWGMQALGFLIQVLPPAWITIYFFRGQYRYSFRRVRRIFAGVLAAEALLFATVSMGFYHAGFGQVYLAANLVFACCVAACFCLLARLARAGLKKKLFIFLLALNYACLVMCLEYLGLEFLGMLSKEEEAAVLAYASEDLILLACASALLFPVFYYVIFRKKARRIWNMEDKGWNLLLAVQIVYYILACAVLLATDVVLDTLTGLVLEGFLLFSEITLFGVAFQLLDLSEKKHEAELENERSRQSLRLQEQQYAGMRDSIEQTRRQRHDLEHHFALLSVWSQKEENLPRIREYLEEYLEESADAAEKFCKNMAANAVLSYYARELGEAGIDFRAKVSLPERMWIKNVHLSVLFGNALKNALEACGKCLEEGMEVPRVFLQAAVIQHALVLRMENSACQKTWKDEGGWHSSRRDGYGTGLSGIEEIAGLYHGSMEIEQKPGTFILKAVLYEEGCL